MRSRGFDACITEISDLCDFSDHFPELFTLILQCIVEKLTVLLNGVCSCCELMLFHDLCNYTVMLLFISLLFSLTFISVCLQFYNKVLETISTDAPVSDIFSLLFRPCVLYSTGESSRFLS